MSIYHCLKKNYFQFLMLIQTYLKDFTQSQSFDGLASRYSKQSHSLLQALTFL